MSDRAARGDLSSRLDQLAAVVRSRSELRPTVGLVLGSGLGPLADAIDEPVAIPFSDIPGWPAPTVPGHVGRLVLGRLGSVPVVCQQGRFHLYEGHPSALVVEPALLMTRLGARTVVLTNAAGGVNPGFGPGTLMVIRDHLNLTGRNPLIGHNDDAIGLRFPDLVDMWRRDLRDLMHRAARDEGVQLEEGVYAGLTGPSYETPAEIRMLLTIGADAVGMSTVLEAIALRWAGAHVAGVSLISNFGAGVTGAPITHEEVQEAAAAAGPSLGRVLRRFIALVGEGASA